MLPASPARPASAAEAAGLSALPRIPGRLHPCPQSTEWCVNGNRVLASGIFHVFLQRERPSAALWHLLILGSCFLVLLWASVREAFPALHLTPVCLQKTRGQFVSFSKLSGTLPVGHPRWQDITGAWPSLETRSEPDSQPGLPQAKSLRGSPPSWQQSSLLAAVLPVSWLGVLQEALALGYSCLCFACLSN